MYLLQHWTMLGCIARASLFWPAAALLGISPVNTVLWKYLYKFMHCSFNENYRIVETPKYPHTKEWLNQLLYGHWVEYYATVKKKKNQQHYSQLVKPETNPSVHWHINGSTNVMYIIQNIQNIIIQNIIQPLKERKICNMLKHEWTWGHYAKWNNQVTKRQKKKS